MNSQQRDHDRYVSTSPYKGAHPAHDDTSVILERPQRVSLLPTNGGGYTEFFSWGNDEDGQLGHGQENNSRKTIFNLPKSLSFEVMIQHVSCGVAHTSFISSKFRSEVID